MSINQKSKRTPISNPQKKSVFDSLSANKKTDDITSLMKNAKDIDTEIASINNSIDLIESDITTIQSDITTINVELDTKQDLLPDKIGNAGLYLRVNSTEDDFEYAAASGGVSDGDKGDVIVSGLGTVWTIDPTTLAPYLTTASAASTYYALTNPSGYISGITGLDVTTALGYTPVNKAGDSMIGYLTLNADPTSSLQAATKQYVDNIAAGINFHSPAHAATTGNLSSTYLNGVSGVGATLTSTVNIALVIDTHTLLLGERVLVWQQTAGLQNGIYEVTNTGSASAPWVLTRATDADNSPSGELQNGDFCFIQQGATYGGFGFILNTSGTITVGVTSVNYVQFNAAQVVAAGYGLQELTPNVLSVDTSLIATVSSLSSYLTTVSAASTYQPIGTYATGTGTATGTNTGDQTSIVGISGTKANFDTACTDGDFVYVGDAVLNPEGWTTIVKSANQDVTNSATLVSDTSFQFSVVAGGHYMVEMSICYSGNDTTGDYKNAIALSAGLMRGHGHCISINLAASAIINNLFLANNAITTNSVGCGVIANLDHLNTMIISYNFYASANATFLYQFANNTAGAGRTSRTWKGSILKYKRID